MTKKTINLFLTAVLSSLISLPMMAVEKAQGERAVLQISCKELLDLATYGEYFNERVELSEGESKTYVLSSHLEGDRYNDYTNVTFTLLDVNSEYHLGFLEAKWENYMDGKLINSDSEQICVERNEVTNLDLEASRAAYLFRNSCTLSIVQ